MQGDPALLPMRDWAMSPDAMVWLVAELQKQEAPVCIEFGSGQSTIIIASVLKHIGGRLISVEHDEEYSSRGLEQVSAAKLSGLVERVLCPLIGSPGDCLSYDLSNLPQVNIDIALVDGPPQSNGVLTRLPPLDWTIPRLNPDGIVFLDDANRIAEQECSNAIQEKFPNVIIESLPTEKGLLSFRNPRVRTTPS